MSKSYTFEQSRIDYIRMLADIKRVTSCTDAEARAASSAIVEHRLIRRGGYCKVITSMSYKIQKK